MKKNIPWRHINFNGIPLSLFMIEKLLTQKMALINVEYFYESQFA